MIVPTMTPEEIYAEISKDWTWIADTIDLLGKSFKRVVLKWLKFPAYHLYMKVSKNTNITYYFLFIAYRRGQWNKCSVIVFTKYNHENGKTCICLGPGTTMCLYTSHFIKRYSEREMFSDLANSQWKNLDAEVRFLVRNFDKQRMTVRESFYKLDFKDESLIKEKEKFEWMKFQATPGYEREEYAGIDGMCLSERNIENKDIIIFNTFVSYNQMRTDQATDCLMSYLYVLIRKMELVYPNQKKAWVSFFQEKIDKIGEARTINDWLLSYGNTMIELNNKYPLPQIF